jgi:hypothetical protein
LPLLNDKLPGEKRSREESLLLLVWLGRQIVAINMNSVRTSHWTRSHNHCCHGKETVSSLFVVGVDEAVNNVRVSSGAIEMQQSVSFSLLSSYKTMRTAFNSTKCYVLRVYACILALVVQQHITSFLHRIMLSHVACLAVPNFFNIIS